MGSPRYLSRSVFAAAAIVIAAGVSACAQTTAGTGTQAEGFGGPAISSSGGASSGSAPRSTGASSPSPSGSSSLPSTAKLDAIVVQDADLPATWDSSPYEDDTEDDDAQAQLIKCVGTRDTTSAETGESHSDDYDLDDLSISSVATSFKTADDVSAKIALYTSPKFSACYQQLFTAESKDQLPTGTTIQGLTFSFVAGPNGGPSNVAAVGHGKVTIAVAGQTTTLYEDVIIMSGKQIAAEVDFTNFDSAFPAALESQVVAAMAKRVAAA